MRIQIVILIQKTNEMENENVKGILLLLLLQLYQLY